MAEELPDGTYQGYSTYCPNCKVTIKTNLYGHHDEPHVCQEKPPAKEVFTDLSRMPFGKLQGTVLRNVPADHLIWLYDNGRSGRLTDYIKDNMQALKFEKKNKR